jgi:hypothetical protein
MNNKIDDLNMKYEVECGGGVLYLIGDKDYCGLYEDIDGESLFDEEEYYEDVEVVKGRFEELYKVNKI